MQGDVERFIVSDFPEVSLADLLRKADVILHAIIGENLGTHLSNDGRDLVTEYRIESPVVLVSRNRSFEVGARLRRPVVLEQRGGTTVLEGHKVSVLHAALKPLKPDTEAILFLHTDGDKYRIAMDYLGVFAIEGSKIRPLSLKGGLGRFEGASVGDFLHDVRRASQVTP